MNEAEGRMGLARFSLLLTLAAAHQAQPNDLQVVGRVLDASSGTPLAEVRVTLSIMGRARPTPIGATSDDDDR
jgi:hypothetical protein